MGFLMVSLFFGITVCVKPTAGPLGAFVFSASICSIMCRGVDPNTGDREVELLANVLRIFKQNRQTAGQQHKVGNRMDQ